MPEGKVIPVEPGEYAELDGLEPNATIKFSGTGTMQEGGLLIQGIQFETEGPATREMKKMRGQDESPQPYDESGGEEF